MLNTDVRSRSSSGSCATFSKSESPCAWHRAWSWIMMPQGEARESQKVTLLKCRHTVCSQAVTREEGQLPKHQVLNSSSLLVTNFSISQLNSIWLFSLSQQKRKKQTEGKPSAPNSPPAPAKYPKAILPQINTTALEDSGAVLSFTSTREIREHSVIDTTYSPLGQETWAVRGSKTVGKDMSSVIPHRTGILCVISMVGPSQAWLKLIWTWSELIWVSGTCSSTSKMRGEGKNIPKLVGLVASRPTGLDATSVAEVLWAADLYYWSWLTPPTPGKVPRFQHSVSTSITLELPETMCSAQSCTHCTPMTVHPDINPTFALKWACIHRFFFFFNRQLTPFTLPGDELPLRFLFPLCVIPNVPEKQGTVESSWSYT